MSENENNQYRLLSPWAYVGYGILFTLPVIGWILAIVFALNDDNLNRRNFARGYWCGVLVAVIVRKGQVIVPFGNDHIEAGNSVVILSRDSGIKDLNEVIRR